MTARGLSELIPPSLLAGRWIAVLVCYLDDSGKDKLNPATALAGYIAKEDDWKTFEAQVEPWFSEFKVDVLHAKDMHASDGEFRDWTVLRKQAFVARICQAMSRSVAMGMSMAASKEGYKEANQKLPQPLKATPYTFCFNALVNWTLFDVRLGKAAHEEGVAFVLETGHENNPQAEWLFNLLRERHEEARNALRSISFVAKDSSRAIQVADLLAFYSRRSAVSVLKKDPLDDHSRAMLNLISGSVPHRGFVATDLHDEEPFGAPDAPLPRFLLPRYRERFQ